MFSFINKKIKINSPLWLPVTTDIHSHILPGIDDGAPDIDSSLFLIKGLYALGIRRIIATPHIIGDIYRNTPDTIQNALEKVKKACTAQAIDMEISAAAEYMLDDHFMELLDKKSALLTLYKNLVLTEISYSDHPANLDEMAFRIITSGYQPVLAHPERYFYYHQNYAAYSRLKDRGFHLQVNLLSLTGYYGKAVRNAAKFILNNNLASLVGTDLHHERHLSALQNKDNLKLFKAYLGDKKMNNIEELAMQ